jgi:integrase
LRHSAARRHVWPTLRELAEEWIRVASKRLVKPSNEWEYHRHLAPLWEETEETLSPLLIESALLDLLRENGGTLGPSTVNKVRSFGLRVVKAAQKAWAWGYGNPFTLVPRLPEPERVFPRLTVDECRRTLRRLRPDRRREALFMLVMGPRPGEEKALQKCDVDVKRRILVIQRSNGRNRTKTGKVRTMPIPRALWPVLVEAMRLSPSEIVFPRADGARQLAATNLTRTLRTAMGAAGVVTGYRYRCHVNYGCGHEETRATRDKARQCGCGRRMHVLPVPVQLRWYDLRHLSATLHAEAGCNPLAVTWLLGHGRKNTTEARYLHLGMHFIRKEISKLARALMKPPRKG